MQTSRSGAQQQLPELPLGLLRIRRHVPDFGNLGSIHPADVVHVTRRNWHDDIPVAPRGQRKMANRAAYAKHRCGEGHRHRVDPGLSPETRHGILSSEKEKETTTAERESATSPISPVPD